MWFEELESGNFIQTRRRLISDECENGRCIFGVLCETVIKHGIAFDDMKISRSEHGSRYVMELKDRTYANLEFEFGIPIDISNAVGLTVNQAHELAVQNDKGEISFANARECIETNFPMKGRFREDR